MDTNDANRDLSRRTVIKRALKGSAYAAPIILTSSVLASPVGAVSPVAPFTCVQPRTEFLIVFGRNQIPNTSKDIYVAANTSPRGPLTKVGTYATDATGFVTAPFPVTFDYSIVRSVFVYTVNAGANPNPAFPDGSYTPNSALNCSPGTMPATSLEGIITERPTNATCAGNASDYLEYVGVNLVNAQPGTPYDIYLRPNNANPAGTFTKVGSGTVNSSGVMTFFARTTVSTLPGSGFPSSLTVNVVASGAPSTSALFTQTVSSSLSVFCPTPATTVETGEKIGFADRS